MLYTQDMLREVHDKSERSHNTDTEPTSTNQMSEQMSLMPPDHGYKWVRRYVPPGYVQGHAMELCCLIRMDQSQLLLISFLKFLIGE